MSWNETEPESVRGDAPHTVADESLTTVRGIRRAFLSICRCGNVLFSPHRITTDQYSLMFAIQHSPGICNAEVSEQVYAEPHTVTAMIALLERRGLLYRKPSPSDGRVRFLYLSEEGEALMKQLTVSWESIGELLLECVNLREGEQALRFLDAVSNEMNRKRESLC